MNTKPASHPPYDSPCQMPGTAQEVCGYIGRQWCLCVVSLETAKMCVPLAPVQGIRGRRGGGNKKMEAQISLSHEVHSV